MSIPATTSTSTIPTYPSLSIKSKSALTQLNKKQVVDYAVQLADDFQTLLKHLLDPVDGLIARLQS